MHKTRKNVDMAAQRNLYHRRAAAAHRRHPNPQLAFDPFPDGHPPGFGNPAPSVPSTTADDGGIFGGGDSITGICKFISPLHSSVAPQISLLNDVLIVKIHSASRYIRSFHPYGCSAAFVDFFFLVSDNFVNNLEFEHVQPDLQLNPYNLVDSYHVEHPDYHFYALDYHCASPDDCGHCFSSVDHVEQCYCCGCFFPSSFYHWWNECRCGRRWNCCCRRRYCGYRCGNYILHRKFYITSCHASNLNLPCFSAAIS